MKNGCNYKCGRIKKIGKLKSEANNQQDDSADINHIYFVQKKSAKAQGEDCRCKTKQNKKNLKLIYVPTYIQ